MAGNWKITLLSESGFSPNPHARRHRYYIVYSIVRIRGWPAHTVLILNVTWIGILAMSPSVTWALKVHIKIPINLLSRFALPSIPSWILLSRGVHSKEEAAMSQRGATGMWSVPCGNWVCLSDGLQEPYQWPYDRCTGVSVPLGSQNEDETRTGHEQDRFTRTYEVASRNQ